MKADGMTVTLCSQIQSSRMPHSLGKHAFFATNDIQVDCRRCVAGMPHPALNEIGRDRLGRRPNAKTMTQALAGRHWTFNLCLGHDLLNAPPRCDPMDRPKLGLLWRSKVQQHSNQRSWDWNAAKMLLSPFQGLKDDSATILIDVEAL